MGYGGGGMGVESALCEVGEADACKGFAGYAPPHAPPHTHPHAHAHTHARYELGYRHHQHAHYSLNAHHYPLNEPTSPAPGNYHLVIMYDYEYHHSMLAIH